MSRVALRNPSLLTWYAVDRFLLNFLYTTINFVLVLQRGGSSEEGAARRARSGKLDQPVYLNDDLTPARKEIFQLGRHCKFLKLIIDIWIMTGRINLKSLNGQIL